MNALEFLNTELKQAGLNFQVLSTCADGECAVAWIGFKGSAIPVGFKGDVDEILNVAAIMIEDYPTFTFYDKTFEATKLAEFSAIVTVLVSLSSKWQQVLEDQKQNNRALRWAKRNFKDLKFASATEPYKDYIMDCGGLLNALPYGQFKDELRAEFPVYDQPQPKPKDWDEEFIIEANDAGYVYGFQGEYFLHDSSIATDIDWSEDEEDMLDGLEDLLDDLHELENYPPTS